MFDVAHFSIISRLRYKYTKNNDTYNNAHLDRLLWYSFPVVYTKGQYKKIAHEYDLLKQKRKRYKKYVRGMVETFGRVYLLTLTFSDEYYNDTTTKTRKKYCEMFLGEISEDYFACLDIGKINNREHFHCVVALQPRVKVIKEDKHFIISNFEWKYGFHNIKPIGTEGKDFHSVLNYALKSAAYSYKRSDGVSIRPFHKRGVLHYEALTHDSFLI